MTDREKNLYNSIVSNSIAKVNNNEELDALDKLTLMFNLTMKEITDVKKQINDIVTTQLTDIGLAIDNKAEIDKNVIEHINEFNNSIKDTIDFVNNTKAYSTEDLIKMHENGKTWDALDELIGGSKGTARKRVERYKKKNDKHNEELKLYAKIGEYLIKNWKFSDEHINKIHKKLNIEKETLIEIINKIKGQQMNKNI